MKDKQLLKNTKKLLPGSGLSWHKFETPDKKILQTFKSPFQPFGFREVEVSSKEVTALCPLTGFPDQYEVSVRYTPDRFCIESKSAKFYFGAYRNFKGFIETISEKIATDWMFVSKAHEVTVAITMNARGGVVIKSTVQKIRQ